MLSHIIFGVALRIKYFQGDSAYSKYTTLALFNEAIKEEMKALEPYYKIGLPISFVFDLIILWLY